MIDEKSYYLFGRNKDVCDFVLEHQSVSRVHAALVYHKHLDRPFLVDLGSSKYTIFRFFTIILVVEIQGSNVLYVYIYIFYYMSNWTSVSVTVTVIAIEATGKKL